MDIKAIIVEDEFKMRKVLLGQIERMAPGILVVAECDSIAMAYEQILLHQPDVVFLDVELMDGTGFDLLYRFEEINFYIIFTTAYDEYAVKAFKFNAIDYLLKPIDPDELHRAVLRLKSSLEHQTDHAAKLKVLLNNLLQKEEREQKLAIPENRKITYVRLNDIVFLAAKGMYTSIKQIDGTSILSSKILGHYAALLQDKGFFRVHRSFLVNMRLVSTFNNKDGGYAEMENGDIVEVARERKAEFLDQLSSGFDD